MKRPSSIRTTPLATAALSGTLFGVGLVVSGMTDPHNIIGFLDFFGRWNPNLMLVMAGAIAVHASVLALRGWRSPHGVSNPSVPPRGGIDRALGAGAAVFGIGWGLVGYCPGPAIVSLGFGAKAAALFVGASIVGMLLADWVRSRMRAPAGPNAEDVVDDRSSLNAS
jgi:uncharacterized membrane protein YedE/YeeE